ncbi:MAG: tetratricopeptide repeat protein [Alphaproteobacteria bacterium]|nr:tetratricopeptide repeat protein [Alphaproteobacteria bacterium]
MEDLEKNALDLLKSREYERAAKVYLQLAMKFPDNEDYLAHAANCYDSLKEKKVALSLYKKVLTVNPHSISALLNVSTIYYELKKIEKSVAYAEQALDQQKDNFAAIMNRGNALYAMGNYNAALHCYEQMFKINPHSYNAILNIANTSYNLGLFEQAALYADKAIALRPNSADPYIIAGNAYIELHQNEQATRALKQASELAPLSDWLCNSISNLFQKVGNWRQALHYAWKAMTLKGAHTTIDDHINFAALLYAAQDEDESPESQQLVDGYITRWEKAYPDHPVIHHAASALRHVQDIQTMDLGYVKSLFDGFASSFDEILAELDYKVPDLIAQHLKDYLKIKLFKKRRILDLGCGTGLCAQALKQYFPNEEYFGVDISECMLDVADKKNLYQALFADDILSFLETNSEVYHAVVAGDVLTYIGELKPLFRLLTKAVKFNGYLAFSITKNLVNNQDFYLVPSGRFVHSLSYVQRLLKYCGFKTLVAEEAILRHEGAKKVSGYVIIAQKEIEVIFE